MKLIVPNPDDYDDTLDHIEATILLNDAFTVEQLASSIGIATDTVQAIRTLNSDFTYNY
jgi:hypothetical protein